LKLCRTLQGHEEAVYAASFAPDESYVVSGCSGGRIHLWDGTNAEASKPLATVENAHDLGVTSLAFASTLVTTSKWRLLRFIPSRQRNVHVLTLNI